MTEHHNDALPPEVRRDQIMALLQRHGQVTVKWCAEQLGVSEVTIRSDFALLEREGLLRRVWGSSARSSAVAGRQFRVTPEGAVGGKGADRARGSRTDR